MLIETGRLVGAGLLDAASIPVIMMGFRLTESCAVIGLDGNQVAFCGRGDLEVLANEFLLRDYVAQMLTAVDNSGVEALLMVGYSEDPAGAARLLDSLAARLSPHVAIGKCVVASQQTVWGVIGGHLDGSGVPFCLDEELNKVKDVLPDGVRASRAEALADVRPTLEVYEAAEVVLATAEALQNLENLTPQYQQNRLRELLEGPALSLAPAVELAVLLDNPDHVSTVLHTIAEANAEAHHTQLAAALKYCPQGYDAPVLGLLAISCWLTYKGAQMSDCMNQLDHHSPGHPLWEILCRVQFLPPSVW